MVRSALVTNASAGSSMLQLHTCVIQIVLISFDRSPVGDRVPGYHACACAYTFKVLSRLLSSALNFAGAPPNSPLTAVTFTQDKSATDNRANQLNPNSGTYDSSRSGQPMPAAENPAQDNHANQLNPNNAEFKGDAGGSKSASK